MIFVLIHIYYVKTTATLKKMYSIIFAALNLEFQAKLILKVNVTIRFNSFFFKDAFFYLIAILPFLF